ncbi:MAG: hypothetical protein ACO3X1_13890 [Burkholderiaceae bacterium]
MTNNQTDWQELCAQLFEALRAHGTTWSDDVLLDRVWVALRAAESKHKQKLPTQAKPERKLPTRDEAVALYSAVMVANECQTLGDMAETFSHAVLARWGK